MDLLDEFKGPARQIFIIPDFNQPLEGRVSIEDPELAQRVSEALTETSKSAIKLTPEVIKFVRSTAETHCQGDPALLDEDSYHALVYNCFEKLGLTAAAAIYIDNYHARQKAKEAVTV